MSGRLTEQSLCFYYSDENDLFFEADGPEKMKVRPWAKLTTPGGTQT